MVWDEETIRHLKDFWSQGLSTAEIGRRLGASKNAIVGKAHRLELDARPSPIRRDVAKPAPAAALPRMAGPTLPPLASAAVRPVVLLGPNLMRPNVMGPNVQALRPPAALVPRPPEPAPVLAPAAQPRPAVMQSPSIPARRPAPTCCWPIGDPGTKTFRFCDDASLAGKPYCDEHAKLAYVRIRDRKEDAA